MSNINSLRKQMPETESSFVIDIEGDTTKIKYAGEFKCKVMNRKERAFASKHEAFLNGEVVDYLDPLTLILHSRLAYLKYSLISFPDFWKDSDLGYALYDTNVVEAVYSKVLEFEKSWMTEIWGEDYVKSLEGKDESESE